MCLTILGILSSCKDDFMEFDKNMSSVRFVYEKGQGDSITYSFALNTNVVDKSIKIPLNIIGTTKSFDRKVNIQINTEETTAKENYNYFLQECIIPAESTSGELIVKLFEKEFVDELKIVLFIGSNNDFTNGPINESKIKIILTNNLSKPSDWPGPFGDYSLVKHKFIIEVTGKGSNYNEWTAAQIIYYIGELNKALYEYNKVHPGNPLTDENGLVVTF